MVKILDFFSDFYEDGESTEHIMKSFSSRLELLVKQVKGIKIDIGDWQHL